MRNLNHHLLVPIFLYYIFSYNHVNCNPKRVKFNDVVLTENKAEFKIIKNSQDENPNQKILISVLIKNNAYSLPTFLATLETLKCPNLNKKCDLW